MTKQFIVSEQPSILWVNQTILEERIQPYYYKASDIKEINKILNFHNVKKIEELTMLITDGTHQTPEYVIKGTGIKFLTSKNITEFDINFETDNEISMEQHSKLKKTIPVMGDLLMTKIGSRIGVTKTFPRNAPECNIFVSLALLRVKQEIIYPYYLEAFLNSKFGSIQSYRLSKGITQLDFHLGDIKKLLVPVPSKKIQEYIGNKVRKAEELREESKRLKEEAEKLLTQFLKLDSLEQKINKVLHLKANYVLPHDMNDRLDAEHYKKKFTILYEHLKELEQSKVKVLSLKKIIEEGSYGILPDSQDYGKGELIFIRSTDLNDYMIDLDSCEKVPDKYLTPKAKVSPGDILLEIKGAIAGGAIVPAIKTNAIVNGSIFRFRVKSDFNNFYILSVLQSLIGSLQKEQNGANSVISYLSLDVINNLKIPVIDIEKQNEIGDKLKKFVENNMRAKNLIKSAIQDVEDLIEGKFDESKISEGV